MPLAGSLDIRSLLDGRADGHALRPRAAHRQRRDPPGALRDRGDRHRGHGAARAQPDDPARRQLPRLPRASTASSGPFSLVQTRLTARAAVRPRAFLVSARCDNPAAAEALVELVRVPDPSPARSGCSTVPRPGRVQRRRRSQADPASSRSSTPSRSPGTTSSTRRACTSRASTTTTADRPRLVQVDTEYEFRRADRGRPELGTFDAAAWGDERLVPTAAGLGELHRLRRDHHAGALHLQSRHPGRRGNAERRELPKASAVVTTSSCDRGEQHMTKVHGSRTARTRPIDHRVSRASRWLR